MNNMKIFIKNSSSNRKTITLNKYKCIINAFILSTNVWCLDDVYEGGYFVTRYETGALSFWILQTQQLGMTRWFLWPKSLAYNKILHNSSYNPVVIPRLSDMA